MARSRRLTQSGVVQQMSLWWHLAALVPIMLLALSSLNWLPVIGLPVAMFLCIFWVFSFAFTVMLKLAAMRKPKP